MTSTKNNFLERLNAFLFWFALFYLLLFGFDYFFGPEKVDEKSNIPAVEISPLGGDFVLGNLAQFTIKNNSPELVRFDSPCPETPENIAVYARLNGEKLNLSEKLLEACEVSEMPGFTLESGKTLTFSFPSINSDIFSEPGKYGLDLKLKIGDQAPAVFSSDSFLYEEPGFFRSLFRTVVSRPLFNLLAFFIHVLPSHSLGWAIILLTLLVRIILFLPNQKAMKSQRRMQKVQPKLEALKKKYGTNQQMMAMKTMELYKQEKVNPASSCLPMLLQMPFLLGLYFVVQEGLSLHLKSFLYSFNANIDLSLIRYEFFGLNLSVADLFILPILVALAQYLAIKLSMPKKSNQPETKKSKKMKKKPEGMMDQMAQMQKMMLYIMPIMIGVFTATLPSAVGLYWLTSTVFGVIQQRLVNYQLDQKKNQVRRVEKS